MDWPGLFMNTYYSGRSSCPAGLFSFGLLDGPQNGEGIRTGRLTNSPARTNVALFIHRAVRPARSPRMGHVLACLGWAGAVRDFGLSRFATVFMNNPG
ncbi:MAG: hypothetical protein ABI945_04810 [Nitrospirales bacterium]